MSDLELVLNTVHEAISGQGLVQKPESASKAALQKLAQKANVKLVELHNIIRRKVIFSGPGQTVSKFPQLHWLQEKHHVKEIQQELISIKIDIVSVLGAVASCVFHIDIQIVLLIDS